MVKYNPRTWFDLIFHSYSRQIMKILFPALLMMGVFTALITYFLQYYYQISFKSTTAVHSLLGIVLGLILVFRMNSAYDRWWEGRKLWGALVNNTRTLAIKLNAFIPKEDRESREFFKDMVPNFAFALKEHLREGVRIEELKSKDEN
ncbi:MAG: hypothetical protein OEY34_10845, partial [Cyclobacteriaceae bacterium]|nr:hypothetical protein [Cyclobacteriaceae bacterium]